MNARKTIFNKYESAARSYCRRFDTVFTSAQGSIIHDVHGTEYLDFLAACGALNYGHNDPDMSKALIQHIQSNKLAIGLDLHTETKAAFLDSFARLILRPRALDYRIQFTGPTGTNAVEAALKLARKITKRHNIIAFTNGFHGVTHGALAATGNKFHRMELALPGITRMPFEHYHPGLDSLAYLEQMLSDPSAGIEAPAAILLETVQGEGGLNAASDHWLQNLATLAKRHGALLIVDDVQAGCGRTGTFFSFEPAGIEPDLVVLSKSISGYGLPMAMLLIRPEHDAWAPAEHNGTFRGNTHAFVTARVMLEKFWSDNNFSLSLQYKAQKIRQHLEQLLPLLPNSRIKGRGMMSGLDLGSGQLADQVVRRLFQDGLLLETGGPHDEVLKIFAPLTTPERQLDKGLAMIERAVRNCVVKRERVSC